MAIRAVTLNILVDCTFIVPEKNRGTQTYLDALLIEMNKSSRAQLVCLTTTTNHSHYSETLGLNCRLVRISGSNRLIRGLIQQLFSGYFLARSKCDLLFCPGSLSPVFINKPCVVTIHDMAYRDVPYSVSKLNRLWYRLIVPFAARRADKIIAVSDFSKSRILHWLDVSTDSVHTVHEGPLRSMDHEPVSWGRLRRQYNLTEDVFLSISSGLPNKNIYLLIQAYLMFVQRTASDNTCLVLVGHRATDDMEQLLEQSPYRNKVVFTGFITEREKVEFLKRSRLYIFSSLYEGFGLPVLEAQSCGLPLICSKAGSLPEIAGLGALYFDPSSVDDLALKLSEAYANESLREELIENGYQNAARYSWSRAADETIDVCYAAMESHAS